MHHFSELISELNEADVTLVAVSKTQPVSAILRLYEQGQRIFGENRVQELLEKLPLLPPDIQWHLIGHLQSNKVRQVIPHVAMIHAVDSIKLLDIIQKEASKIGRNMDVLLQIKISAEATKYGFDPKKVLDELQYSGFEKMNSIRIRGVMGMASFVEDQEQIREEFHALRMKFQELKQALFAEETTFDQISMGMSGDFRIAIEEGSTMVRIGSLLFGER